MIMDRNEAIDIVRKNLPYGRHQLSEALETLIPELKESEDNRIRKQILDCFRTMKQQGCFPSKHKKQYDSWITWIEKQGSQNLADSEKTCKDEPKFKIGDWIIKNDGKDCFSDGSYVLQITNIDDNMYKLSNNCYLIEPFSDTYRLWTIEDAKDGDVLVDNLPFIFKKIDANKYSYAYCGISTDGDFRIKSEGASGEWTWMQDIKPATKEQRDLLFSKMKEAGYKWNTETKTLEKLIEPKFKVGDWIKKNKDCISGVITNIDDGFYRVKYIDGNVAYINSKFQDDYELAPNKFDITTLIPFESRVLVRSTDDDIWRPAIYGFTTNPYRYYIVGGFYWEQCIPYEGNEQLLGATDDCDYFYKRWL